MLKVEESHNFYEILDILLGKFFNINSIVKRELYVLVEE